MKNLMLVRTKQNDVTLCYAQDIHKLLTITFDHKYSVERLAELDTVGVVLIVHHNGLQCGLKPNTNLYPFFFVGDCYLVDRELKGLNDTQIHFIKDWLQSLKDPR